MKITTQTKGGESSEYLLQLNLDEMKALVSSILAAHGEKSLMISLLMGMANPKLLNQAVNQYAAQYPEDTKPGPGFSIWVAIKLVQAYKNTQSTEQLNDYNSNDNQRKS